MTDLFYSRISKLLTELKHETRIRYALRAYSKRIEVYNMDTNEVLFASESSRGLHSKLASRLAMGSLWDEIMSVEAEDVVA